MALDPAPTVTLAPDAAGPLVAHLRFPAGWPVFAGHFPGAPLVPAVFLVDAARRAIERRHGPLAIAEVRDARFRQPVGPDETVEAAIDLRGDASTADLRASVALTSARGAVAAFELVLRR